MASLASLLIFGGNLACKKKAAEVTSKEAVPTQEGLVQFEGTVKTALGKYMYIPAVPGFDILVQGSLTSGNIQSLIGKEVRGEGEISPESASLLIANTIEVKQAEGQWEKVFTRSEDVVLDDYLTIKARDEFKPLENLSYNKKEGWEGKEKAKIYGQLEKKEVGQGQAKKEVFYIVLFDSKGKESGRIIIDNFTDFARFYINKLRLFDKFWFYLNIKDTVDWKIRRKTKEMFHADVLFAGLF
ncbi:MAG: hypothetical protein ACE5GI_00275 [Candidatus Aminicenantales bacterium]